MTVTKKDILMLALFSFVLFILGNWAIPVTDPVESNYTLTAKEMLLSGDYISPRICGKFWYDKPAFFYWELIAAFSVFGINDFAARFFPVVFGTIGVVMTYLFARKIYERKTALIASFLLATSFGYWLISKTVITDLTLFVFFNAVLVFFYIAYTSENKNWYYVCYLFAGLAVLTKGPIGILLPGFIITIFIIVRRDFREIPRMKPLGFIIFAAVVASWYYPMYQIHGKEFLDTFLGVHNMLRATQSEHPMWDVWWYYSVLFFIMFFPWAFVTLPQTIIRYVKNYRATHELPRFDTTKLFLLIWAITINLFYQQMATKYSTYTLPSMLPIVILAARYIIDAKKEKLVKRLGTAWAICLVLLTFFVAIPQTQYNGQSCHDTAAFLREHVNTEAGDMVVSYGDYKMSIPYYSEMTIYDVDTRERMEDKRPDGKSWRSKNVMPLVAVDDLPRDHDVYMVVNKKYYEYFPRLVNVDEWDYLATFPDNTVYVRRAK